MYTFFDKYSFPYTIGPVIGKGTYGTVYSAVHNHTGREYALKKISKEKGLARRELHIHMALSDIDNTVPIHEVIDNNDHVLLFMERHQESLLDRARRGPLPERDVAEVMYEIITWLRAVHARGICYCDLKPSNIVFRSPESTRPHMIDFGCSRIMPKGGSPLRSRAGTVLYMAPDVLLKNYDTRADLWSAGTLVYYLLTGWYPLVDWKEEVSREEYQRRILTFETRDIRPHPNLSPEALDFIQGLMRFEPAMRLTSAEALLHPFLQNLL